jgi:predicted amidohydrolase
VTTTTVPSQADERLRYSAAALQLHCHGVGRLSDSEVPSAIDAALRRVEDAVIGTKSWVGDDLALVVLPEYVLTGFPVGSLERWRAVAAVDPDGPVVGSLGALAERAQVFVAANLYEREPAFPNLFFQSSLVFAPDATVVLRYRRLHSLFSPTPHDVWDRYLDRFGLDGVLPVARTQIGALAAVASDEILFPELARAFEHRGAEVLVHSSSEQSSEPRPKAAARAARAVENLVWVVSANTASVTGYGIPAWAAGGGSEIIDPEGRVRSLAGPGETFALARVDLELGRQLRSTPGMHNLPARLATEVYAHVYAEPVRRAGALDGGGVTETGALRAVHAEAIERARARRSS